MTRPVAALFISALLAAAVSACQSGGSHPSAGATPPASQQQFAALAREYSQCVRDHGIPNFPDPTISDGNLSYGADDNTKAAVAAHPEAITACKSIRDRLSQSFGKNWRPTAADMQKLLQFAKCVREHGVAEWPDPDADGRFTVTPKLEDEDPQTRIYPALTACKKYWEGPVGFHGGKK